MKTTARTSSSDNPTQPHKPRVALGMSGGVDSSVCAHLLVEQGYDVTGVYLECWRAPGCRTEEDRADALKVALSLGIPFRVLDFKEAYRQKVVEYFFTEYKAGRTPNPDVLCNKEIKFGLFYEWAMQEGFEYVATGHYAKIEHISNTPVLAIPADTHKDQTYFLYLLTEEHLRHTIFPLADLTKTQVRTEARKRGLHIADKKDSVGICFIGDINVHEFLKERLGENPGDVVDTAGNVIGRHTGLWFYTVGQRHGFTITAKTSITQEDGTTVERNNIPPFYVIEKLPEKNQLVVGFGAATQKQHFTIQQTHWMHENLTLDNTQIISGGELIPQPAELAIRIRHTGELLPCRLEKIEKGANNETTAEYLVTLAEPVKGIAAGQSGVVYLASKRTTTPFCLGGGTIT